MPTPRMPKVETLRTSVRRLPELRKPLSANEKMQNKAKRDQEHDFLLSQSHAL